jgi:CheY-like chemotaxis protein
LNRRASACRRRVSVATCLPFGPGVSNMRIRALPCANRRALFRMWQNRMDRGRSSSFGEELAVAKGLQQEHWLVHVLRRAAVTGAEELALELDRPAAEAWRTACEATGLTQDGLAGHVAEYFRLKVADLDRGESTALRLVPEKLARQYVVYPLRDGDRHLTVATSDPTNFAAEQALGFISGRKAIFEVAPPTCILGALNAGYSPDGAIEALMGRVHEDVTQAVAEAAGGGAGPSARAPSPEIGPILVVDDDPEDRLLVRTVLRKNGWDVEEAQDGGEALARMAADPGYVLVVLDLEMPNVDGREVLARLRATGSNVPVVVLTGSPDPEDEYRLLEGGADDYLRKPLDPPRFIARVKAALRRARMAG